MRKDVFLRAVVVFFCAIVAVYGSIILQQCSAEHPIVFDSSTGKTVSVW
ncbi:MAG: hypothetical protein ACLVKI_06755 [Gordonibacter urolithinfaciens]